MSESEPEVTPANEPEQAGNPTYIGLVIVLALLVWFVCCQQTNQSVKPQTRTPLVLNGMAQLIIESRDSRTGQPIPARFTIVDAQGRAGKFRLDGTRKDVAARGRQGILYTLGRPVTLVLRPGHYTVYVTRGMSWGLATHKLQLEAEKRTRISAQIKPEIDTSAYLAVDPHIHTRSFSDHGDILVQERMISIAGEAIDVAIATDHNVNVDYAPFQQETGTTKFFTSIAGNEVGSLQQGQHGHINIYPVAKDAFLPHSEFLDWTQLLQGIAKSKAPFWTLNHPRWPLRGGLPAGPFRHFGFNRISGSFRRSALGFPFHGIELINADTALSLRGPLPLYLFQDWFALLNHGTQAAGTAGSDSHTVKVPVGQARTYIMRPKGPGKVTKAQIIGAMKQGRSVLSMGLFVTMTIPTAPGAGPGSTLSLGKASHVDVVVRVQAASWIRPRRLFLYLNGQIIGAQKMKSTIGKSTNAVHRFVVPRPAHDAHLVAVGLGDGVHTPPRWQGELMQRENYTVGATNPIFLDANNDKRYDAPHTTAKKQLAKLGHQAKPAALWPLLRKAPPVIGVQLMSLLQHKWRKGQPSQMAQWRRWLDQLSPRHPLYKAYRRSVRRPSHTP